MYHTTSDEAASNRAENEELFKDLIRLEEMLESIQKLNSASKMHLLSPIHQRLV